MKRIVFLVLVVLAALPGERIVAQDAPVTTALTGSTFVYAVRAGDSLRTVGARFGASTSTLFAELVDWPSSQSWHAGLIVDILPLPAS